MTADDFTNLVAAEIEWRTSHPFRDLPCYELWQSAAELDARLEYVELEQVCDCPYGEPDAQERCVECGRKYREVRRG